MAKRILRICALIIAVAALTAWTLLGANRGWTKTSVRVAQTDPIIGTYYLWEKRFVPGLDLLGACLAGALGLYAISFFVSNPKTKRNYS